MISRFLEESPVVLAVGSKMGPYEILAPLGAGGMGEVYRARDTKLDREVAIKVLPDVFSRDAERLARFEREAKLLATLNHTNIAAIHGFEKSGDVQFLVLELVEGETLAQRLKSGAFAVEDALEVAKQMAEALEAAHEKGVIHRDLKPGNVMVRPDGTVKVLDFGLAKAMAEESSASVAADSPTITANYTRPGVVLGTAAYMSPEQARGRPLDKRTDIWSFGIILFECLSGERLFQGETANDSMGAILHKEPEWSLLSPDTPPTIQLLLRRCLTKDLKRRLHDIADARIELEQALADPTGTSLGLAAAALDVSHRRIRSIMRFTLPALLVLATALAVWFAKPSPTRSRTVRRFVIERDERVIAPAISPDGRMIAFVQADTLWVRDLDDVEPRALTQVEGSVQAFWSPDSAWIGYLENDRIMKVAAAGGDPILIGRSPEPVNPGSGGAGWTDDDRIIFSTGHSSGLLTVPATGGTPTELLAPNDDETDFHQATVLPGNRGVLFIPHPDDNSRTRIDLFEEKEGRRTIFDAGVRISDIIYSASGHILYQRRDDPKGIWAVPFSLDRLEADGNPFLILPDVGHVSASNMGDLVYAPGGAAREPRQAVWLDRSGTVTGTIGPPMAGLSEPALSPDGKQLAVTIADPEAGKDIWIIDVQRKALTRLTSEKRDEFRPIWSPDGLRIGYSARSEKPSPGGPPLDFLVRNADGSSESEILFHSVGMVSMSSDWSQAALVIGEAENLRDIVFGSAAKPAERELFLAGEADEAGPAIHPDGRFIAYLSQETGEREIYLKRFPEGPGRWRVSLNGGTQPKWSREGDRLFFIADERLMEVEIELGDAVRIGTPTPVFQAQPSNINLNMTGYDVAPGAERFIVARSERAADEPTRRFQIIVVENWFEEFKAKVPTGGRR